MIVEAENYVMIVEAENYVLSPSVTKKFLVTTIMTQQYQVHQQ